MDIQMQWVVRRTIPAIAKMVRRAKIKGYTQRELVTLNKKTNHILLVARDGEEVVGFLAYAMFPESVELLRFVVSVEHRRQGVGSHMLIYLQRKLRKIRKNRAVLSASVGTDKSDLLYFLRSHGFIASRSAATEDGETRYQMVKDIRAGTPVMIGELFYAGISGF